MQESSRIEAGRRRAARAKRTVALVAAGSFLAVFGLARVTHPGTAAAGSGTTSSSPSSSAVVQSDDDGFSFNSGAIQSSGLSVPQVSTHTS
jgi:hypothetical protein